MSEADSSYGLILLIGLLIPFCLIAAVVLGALITVCKLNWGVCLSMALLVGAIFFPPLFAVSVIVLVFAGIFGPSKKQRNLLNARGQTGLARRLSYAEKARRTREREDEEIRQYHLRQARS